jgi:DNA-directed RNA polymerase specialized sigma24 family protein
MSPLTLRRYRAERLLREEFERLRGRVLTTVAGRLRVSGVRLDPSDLEACYALAWHGLYTAVLDGQEIANPTGWLVLVTFRRAIEEHRARTPSVDRDAVGVDGRGGPHRAGDRGPGGVPALAGGAQDDLAAELDDRMRLRQLFEGLRGRLSARELQAAALCYLQGLSRSEAAARMGVSEARMRKLMEGHGPGRPGVAGKVGALVETIRSGAWCEEQGSLMRGFAYGVLAPDGERYRLALIHNSECPACRAYVLALRGLAAVLPPVPCLLHWALGAGAATGLGAAAASPAVGTGAAAGAAAPAGPAVGAMSASGAAGAAGAAGASVAGGAWLLAGGPVGAKFAVGCLLALGVGAGCVELAEKGAPTRARLHGPESAPHRGSSASAADLRTANALLTEAGPGFASGRTRRADGSTSAAPVQVPASGGAASREFGPERASAIGGEPSAASGAGRWPAPARTAARADQGRGAAARSPSVTAEPAAPLVTVRARSAGVAGAQREFAPG